MQKSCNILSFDFNSTQVKVLEEHSPMHSLSLFRVFLSASVHCMQWMGVLVVFGFFNFSLQLEVLWENVVCQVQI